MKANCTKTLPANSLKPTIPTTIRFLKVTKSLKFHLSKNMKIINKLLLNNMQTADNPLIHELEFGYFVFLLH